MLVKDCFFGIGANIETTCLATYLADRNFYSSQ